MHFDSELLTLKTFFHHEFMTINNLKKKNLENLFDPQTRPARFAMHAYGGINAFPFTVEKESELSNGEDWFELWTLHI